MSRRKVVTITGGVMVREIANWRASTAFATSSSFVRSPCRSKIMNKIVLVGTEERRLIVGRCDQTSLYVKTN